MSDELGEIVIRYESAVEAGEAIKRIRRHGLRSPLDHLIVEAARVVLIIVPIALVFAGRIRIDHAIAFYCGYFALRWFNAIVKPALLRRFGPHLPATQLASALTMTFNASGVQSETANALIKLKWPSLPAPRVFKEGVLLRIAPEQSLVVASTHLPEGMTVEAFGNQINAWRAGSPA